MKNTLILLLSIITFNKIVCAQPDNNLNYRSPLEIPLIFAANFGELRTNHFHMGVDYKTKHVEGMKIFSVQDGYVSRIKVSSYGYGKAIYINHPEGVTSVYAHCSLFKGKIDSIVKFYQHLQESFEIDIELTADEIKVKKGQVIALSGNTGGSTAPHLHFELRDTKTETALNPLKFGYKIKDSKSPKLSHLKIYSLSKEGYIASDKSFKYKLSLTNSIYYPEQKTIYIPINFLPENGGLGFSFDAYDPYDLSYNKLGIYESKLIINDELMFETKIDSISFDHTRYINTYTDFHEFSNNRRNYHKSFKNLNNPLTIYNDKKNGIIKVKPGDTLNIDYQIFDTEKNKSDVSFKIIITENNEKNYAVTNFTDDDFININKPSYFFNKDSSIKIKAKENTFYEPISFKIKEKNSSSDFTFGEKNVPIQKQIDIHIDINKLNSSILNKYYLTVNDRYLETMISDSTLSVKSKYLGDFRLKTDTIPPKIRQKNFTNNNVSTYNKIRWEIVDTNSGILDYDIYIDDKWQILEYEYKNNTVTFNIPNSLKGQKEVKIVVTDNCSNIQVWKKKLIF